jgi:DNA (cytosine-5)-methyltransferase 1
VSLHHVSLFAGVGGADLGMAAAGIPTLLACEIDKQARGVLAHRFPHATLHDDVRSLTGEHLRRAGAIPDRTILSGGFPCQPFSVAGRRRGMGNGDDRGDLYWQISRLLAEFPARWIVLENVPGLLSIDGGRTFGTILGDLAGLGYGVAYRVLDAQFFGVPQRRRRVFIVGCLGDDRRPVEVLLEPDGGGWDSAAGTSAGSGSAAGARGGVVGTLQSGGAGNRGYRIDAEAAASGHLVPYVKAKRAATDQDDETWRRDDVTPTLNDFDNGTESRATVLAIGGAVTHALTAEGHDASEDGTGRGTPIVAFALRGREEGAVPEVTGVGDSVGALRAASGGSSRDYIAFSHTAGIDTQASTDAATSVLAGHDRMPAAMTTTQVRRLTPRECERLMGWPDDHTAHRIDHKTGAVIPQADSSRYRQCGNGMAAPVVEWIAHRIVEADHIDDDMSDIESMACDR